MKDIHVCNKMMVQPGMSKDQIQKLWPKVVFAKIAKNVLHSFKNIVIFRHFSINQC